MNTTGGKTDETFIRTHTDGGPKPTGQSGLPHGRALAVLRRIARPTIRSGPPVRLGAVTVLLVGAALLILGILLILYGFLSFLTGTIGQATSSSFSVTALFQSILVSDNVVSLRSFVSVKRSCLVRPYSCSHSDSVGLM